MLFMLLTMSISFSACGSDDDDGDLPYNATSYYDNSQIYRTLVDKTWQYIGCDWYDSDKKLVSHEDQTEKEDLYYFSSTEAFSSDVTSDNYMDTSDYYFVGKAHYSNASGYSSTKLTWTINLAGYTTLYYAEGYVVEMTSNEIKLLEPLNPNYYSGKAYVLYHLKLYSNSDNTGSGSSSGSGGNSGGSSSYEVPEIGFEDYTPSTTSMTVNFRIYNQDEAKVTSAKVYYGTSSPTTAVTATVAGSMITAKLTGLKKGTYYKIKCTGTGKGGTGTSDTFSLSTLN